MELKKKKRWTATLRKIVWASESTNPEAIDKGMKKGHKQNVLCKLDAKKNLQKIFIDV